MNSSLKILLVLFLSLGAVRAQIGYNRLPQPTQYTAKDTLALGIDLFMLGQNSAVSIYDTYNDGLHYLLLPRAHYRFNKYVTLDLRLRVENIRDDYVDANKTYWSDDFANHRGGVEVGKVSFDNGWFHAHIGRDYVMPGRQFYEGLLFSQYNYSYDQIWLALRNRYMEIATYYLNLTDLQAGGTLYKRHFNGHRFTFYWGDAWLAFNDVALYGGENRQLEPTLFNPLMLFYPYQKNHRNFESNSLMSFELYLPYRDYYLFAELLIDDYQVDKEDPGDLEPTEWGIKVTLGADELLPGLDLRLNYTRLANRTYNAPLKDYEKYLYKNYPIGHYLGNNFWMLQGTAIWRPLPGLKNNLTLRYLEAGQEALYGPFNKDYMNFTVQEGYSEKFPFGPIRRQSGLQNVLMYRFRKWLTLENRLAWWWQNDLLKDDFAWSLGVQLALDIIP